MSDKRPTPPEYTDAMRRGRIRAALTLLIAALSFGARGTNIHQAFEDGQEFADAAMERYPEIVKDMMEP